MKREEDLLWTLSTQGTLEQLRQFVAKGILTPASIEGSRGTIPQEILRSRDGLVETHVLRAKGNPAELIAAVREHWAVLRDKGLADAGPVKIFVTAEDAGVVVYVFRWKSPESRARAQVDAEVAASLAALHVKVATLVSFPSMNEVYQGFEYKRFPNRGGVELLRGKCTCTVKLRDLEGEIELDGQNGFVIMHRGPVFTQGNHRLMPVTILAHGADSPNPFAQDPRLKDKPGFASALIRVEQNTELPQFGIIRAQSADADFPATAMWVVHWRIHTPLGTIITDPKIPLVFGPTTVHHYPPVGTEFKSAQGPVDVYNVDTNQVVGTLQPGELTAFDIVVTMDDEIPSIMDKPALYHVEMFNRFVTETQLRLPLADLGNDYRVPKEHHYGDREQG